MSVNSHSRERARARKEPVQERSRRTVDGILDAAAHLFGERGYTATTTNHVAELAGVSIGSLYQYFPNKDALLVALEERHLDEAKRALAAAARAWRTATLEPTDWARAFVTTLVEINDSPLHVLIYDTAPPLPHLQRATETMVDTLATEVAFQLRRWGQRSGTNLRARVLVVSALRLVHDLAIRTPPGAARRRCCREIAHVLSAAIAGPPS